jgi:4-alpha-glucanotransferase
VSQPKLLDELAIKAGIAAHYHDIWGAPHALSAETKQAFLAAMGIAAATEEETALSLSTLAAKPWRRALEPVTTLSRPGSGRFVSVVLDADTAGALGWEITAEDGTRHRGTVVPGDLPLGETSTLDGRRLERRLLAVPASLPAGYHRLEVVGGGLPGGSDAATLIIAPEHAYLSDALRRSPGIWGLSLQLYGLLGRASWGIGDFGDLAGFAAAIARHGAGAIGFNPVHALFPGNPAHASPYSPSSRRFLNPLYIDIAAVPDLAECPAAQAQLRDPGFASSLAALRQAPLVDYTGVAAAKLALLEPLWAAFRVNHLERGSARAESFRRFRREHGAALERHATFEALCEHFRGGKSGHLPWRRWPAPYRSPASVETAAFARDHAERVTFHQYLQWEADRQLAAAAVACRENGMSIGLYRDLALGADADGADAWAEQDLIAQDISAGAPPDTFNLKGQDWGLPPFNPHALRDAAYRPFVECVRANMRHTGALRIDHVMGFSRLFWIPKGASPAQGGYVRYPLDDLLAIAALESQRARCVVVGEDLGTVPEGFREQLSARRILSMRLLYFEREDDGAFRPAQSYPELAQVAVGTHDLPTLPGYWRDHDIDVRAALHLLPAADSEATLRQERAGARAALMTLLGSLGLLPAGEGSADADMVQLVDAAYRFLATSPGRFLLVQLDDVLGIQEQANLPGTVDEHPNWRRKLPVPWEEIAGSPRLRRFAEMLTGLRPRWPAGEAGWR